jgi:hypothetical protein
LASITAKRSSATNRCITGTASSRGINRPLP